MTVAASSSSSAFLGPAKRPRRAPSKVPVDAVAVRAPVLGAVAHEREAARVRDVREVPRRRAVRRADAAQARVEAEDRI